MADKKAFSLPFHGNERTMNMNNLLLQNIQGSLYFKHELYPLNSVDLVVQEIHKKVRHLEPWEKGSRKRDTSSLQNASVRGIGSGGIASTAFCILYKLYTLRMTRKELTKILYHPDNGYVKALGVLLVRYTFPPKEFIEYIEDIVDDETELSTVESTRTHPMTVGSLTRKLFSGDLKWYDTILPRIPVPVQKQIDEFLKDNDGADAKYGGVWGSDDGDDDGSDFWGTALTDKSTSKGSEKSSRQRSRSPQRRRSRSPVRRGQNQRYGDYGDQRREYKSHNRYRY